MENYRLTQTGEEVQGILNNAATEQELTAEVERAQGAEQTLGGAIDDEELRAKAAEEALSGAIGDEELRAKAAEEQNANGIAAINAKIPAGASSENQLADKDFVNSSIETATATFRGSYNLVSDLHLAVDATHAQIATLLGTVISEADANDYSYVLVPTSAQTPTEIAAIEKYTYGANGWAFAYALNNSGFTSAQWAAINSGITSGLVAKLTALPTNADLLLLLAGKQDVLTFDDVPVEGSINPVKSGGVHSAIDDEKTARVNAMNALSGRVDTIEGEIPAQASSENQLADKNYVNSSISTATATFRGAFNLISDLGLTVSATHTQIGTALAGEILAADNNDYAFVQVPTSDETPAQILKVERYKFNGTAWVFEYELNNSGFTAAQWAALNSGITSGLVAKLVALPTNDELTLALAGKQDVLTFDNVPTENSNNPVKSGGVYAADKALSDAIEAILLLIPSAATSLNKLVDTDLMNSSISTATATFRGTYNLVSDLSLDLTATHAQIATALAGEIATADNNDYAFVQVPTAVGTPTEIAQTDRYKFNGSSWAYEYTLNNSGFTAAQWAAINSAITTELVAKLTALPTNAELLESLGLLSSGISGINAKIPSAASSENKLVDGTAMETYVAQIVGAIDATFNVTSTDGHVTLAITQVNGVITSVQLTTSDIASAAALNLKASQADLTALAGRVTTAEGNITSLTGRMTTAEGDIDTLTDLYNALQQSAPQVIQPTDTWPVANPSTTVIYRVIDRVNTPPEYYSDYMWNGTSMVLMATYNNAVDAEPTEGSKNLVKSGGVFDMVSQKVEINSFNLYDEDSVEKGYFCGSSGRKSYVAAWANDRGLLKIFWGNNTKITLNCCAAANGAYVCQFDANGNFISGSSQGELDLNETITKAEGAYYVYLEVFVNWINNRQVNFGESLVDYTPYNPIDRYLVEPLTKIQNSLLNKVEINSINLYQDSLAEWGYWIAASGGKAYTEAWVTSRGLFKVYWGNNTKLTVNCAYAQGGTYTAQFDANGDYIADSKVEGTGVQTYTKVNGADYIYVAIDYSTPNKQIVFGESLLDPYLPYSPISGYISEIKSSLQSSTIHLYADSNTGTDDTTHFYGLSAIQNAINAVPQQSADNYVIHVKGSYYFDEPSKFYNAPDYSEYYYGFYVSPTKRNITIVGEGIERTKVVGCLADNLGSSFAYDKYITAEVLGNNCKVVGITISAQNMRYAVHLDRSGYSYCNDYHITYENCKLTHQGNTNDAATVWGATPSPFGLGISSGMQVTMKECQFEKKGGTALYCHDNKNFENPYLLEFINCAIITSGTSLLTFANLGSNVNGIIKLTGCRNYFGGTILAQLSNSGLDVADYGIPLTRIISDNPAMLHYLPQNSNNVGKVLKFSANTTGQSVRIYDMYSGFETLIQGEYGYNGNAFSGVVESDGYRYLDGATDFAGWAMGLKALDTDTNASIQKRLGDCTSTNIKLSVGIVGQAAQEIVFDKDYTNYSDADMLDEINNQLIGITAELYWLAMDYYPETPSLLTCENNTSGVTIKKGMGVHVDGGYVTKATSNEEVDGIALDDIKYGCWGRVIKKAVLNTSYYNYNVVLIDNDSKNYADGARFSIGANAGIFVRDDEHGILKIHQYSNIIVDL